ncbi:hypothetical protein SLEP1_g27331 [Rubroshorea leprosula]|uniref:Protein kinase domain-containing protein n=1 Tax=Rubroshorea leprosula TaxID=152421 RepID=A0AAV5JQ29_9ROSI|nr:hypothetical protein SLEP1_g27331 [Rubroshorea leprosula]
MISPVFPLFFLICYNTAIVGGVNDEGHLLLSFKQSMGNPTAGCMANWNASDVNPCSWHGVYCIEAKVVSLTITDEKLYGVLPPVLGSLSALRHLNLKNNNFHGSLPVELFAAKGLLSLVLSENSFSGPLPVEIGDLRYLQILDVSQNSFNGSIPSSLINCRKLKLLILRNNSFSGSLPNGLGNSLITLQSLDLSYNNLSGSIPIDIGNLSSLRTRLDLSHNMFNGNIPASLGSLPWAVYIDLSFNNLSGSIPQNGNLANVGPTAFIGNPLLCGPPLNNSCQHRPLGIQPPHSSGKHGISSLCVAAITVAGTVVGICLVALLFSYLHKKASACKEVQNVGGYRFEEKLMFGKEIFCFSKKGIETLSEKMECRFVPLDLHFNFDLEQLLRASAFLLGKSAIGIVYKVVLNSGSTVVVRRLENGGDQRYKEFQTEVEAIGKIRHPNIVSLRAYCWSADEKLLIYDYIPNGDLAAAIHGKAGTVPFKPLSWPVRVQIMKGIAKGLAFLHEFSPKRYVHGNLKPSNIILGENMEPHISDFGLARLANIIEDSPAFQGEQMTSRTPPQNSPYSFTTINSSANSCYYQAPEASKATKPSQKWDIYSFGVILLEMISGKPPTGQIGSSETDLVLWIQLSMEERKPLSCIVDPFLAHDWSMENSIAATLKIALACIHKSPDRRPTMRNLSDSLEKLSLSS